MHASGTLRKTASSIWTPFFIAALLVGVARADAQQRWDFEGGQPTEVPARFRFTRTGSGRVGRWVIKVEADAPSGTHVLAQTDDDGTDFRFPMAVANEPSLADLRLSVKCKPALGKVDQACGLVFRYQNENNYYITRANALEQNVRLYKVLNGNRQQFANWSGAVASGAWHELRVEAKDDHFTVFWDGKEVLDAHDQTFSQAGQIGLWTKADSITYFDDLKVDPLAP